MLITGMISEERNQHISNPPANGASHRTMPTATSEDTDSSRLRRRPAQDHCEGCEQLRAQLEEHQRALTQAKEELAALHAEAIVMKERARRMDAMEEALRAKIKAQCKSLRAVEREAKAAEATADEFRSGLEDALAVFEAMTATLRRILGPAAKAIAPAQQYGRGGAV
jgi:hypothetical protein